MNHLGERVSALIDGELRHHERERALAHLTFCADCRAEVEAMRALKNRLRSMDPPGMPMDLTMSLLRMSEPGGPVPLRTRPFHGTSPFTGTSPFHGPSHATSPVDNRPRSAAGPSGPGRFGRTRRVGYVAVGLTSAAMALGTMLMVGGSQAQRGPGPDVMFVQQNHGLTGSPSPSPSPRDRR